LQGVVKSREGVKLGLWYESIMKLFLFLSFLLVLTQGCQPPDCDHPDCGSCANACCEIKFSFKMEAKATNDMLVDSLKAGGADKRYRLSGSEDLTPDHNPSGAVYLTQGVHSTLVHHYNDTLDFLVFAEHDTAMSSHVQAFSISRIWGAYCDYGQNYKNLVGFMKGLDKPFDNMEVVHGCTNKTKLF
jgi:hypothetical protein